MMQLIIVMKLKNHRLLQVGEEFTDLWCTTWKITAITNDKYGDKYVIYSEKKDETRLIPCFVVSK